MDRPKRPESGSDNNRPRGNFRPTRSSDSRSNDSRGASSSLRSNSPRGNDSRSDSRSSDPRSSARPATGRPDRGDRPSAPGRPSVTGRPTGPRPQGTARPTPGAGRPQFASRPDRPMRPDFPSAVQATSELFSAVAQQAPAESGSPDRLEGRNPIQEAIKAGRAINKIWVAKREGKPEPLLSRLIAQAKEAGAIVMEVDRRVLDQMSETHGHQGIIAQVAAHEYVELEDLLSQIRERGEKPFLVLLDDLQESYNLGSILRIADAAGVHGVIIPERRSVGLDSAVAKASAGAIEHVPVARVGNLTQVILQLKEEGFWVAGTDSEGTVDYHKADWTGPLVIVVGSEGDGIGQQMKKHCDFLVSIPMHGQVNSLNAAVAAGIVIFEAAAHRG
ncbi:MAG: 23S rRNA (guanosine(2251)-2'-O)-methyltransferase RlmB [Eubacteriales bacterium]|nr:23S rRNA (guanosine(2251)-2'-O)-methyltransferase RlmB [Eubacteriales bacterium]